MQTTPYSNSLFEQPWWLDIVAPNQWEEILSRDKDGEIVGRLAFVRQGKRVIMPALTQTLGVWISPTIQGDYGKEKQIYFELFAPLQKLKSVTQALSPENEYVLPLRWLDFRMEPRFTYRLTDLSDLEKLYQGFHKTAKKNIKYARNKVKVQDETNVETLLSMLDKTFAVQNRSNPLSRELVSKLVETCEENGTGKYLEAKDEEGNTHSCAYLVYDEKVCYYLLGASDTTFRSSGAQSLLLWEGIQFAAEHSKVFDFEGSMVEGIENFFRQFGGVCTPYYGIQKNTFLEEVLLAAKPRLKRLLGYKI